MTNKLSYILVIALFVALVPDAHCVSISYEINPLGGSSYEALYTVINDTPSINVEEFTVYFQEGLYENLAVTTTPVDWDPLAVQPDPAIPDDGFYDALALNMGISFGDQLGGFGVSFDWLGSGDPGSQFFEIINPFTFDILTSGTTELASATPVPEPASILLMGSGIGMLAAFVRKKYVP